MSVLDVAHVLLCWFDDWSPLSSETVRLFHYGANRRVKSFVPYYCPPAPPKPAFGCSLLQFRSLFHPGCSTELLQKRLVAMWKCSTTIILLSIFRTIYCSSGAIRVYVEKYICSVELPVLLDKWAHEKTWLLLNRECILYIGLHVQYVSL
jgi:hypothetical protein